MNIPPAQLILDWSGERLEQLDKAWQGIMRVEGAITMIGGVRLTFLEKAIRDLVARNVRGDILEAGCWRGGACIYMRAVLDVLGIRDRIVFGCDAFDEGFPEPDPKYPVDADSKLHYRDYFKTPFTKVQRYGEIYGYGDTQLRFVPGYFKDTLPGLPIGRLALLRLDGDLYGSNWEPLDLLYDKLSPGGYVIADDYHSLRHTREAIDDFREARKVGAALQQTDWTSVYWIKEAR